MHKNILIAICGGIASYKAFDLISALKKDNYNIKCILSSGGSKFINKLTLEALLKDEVYDDIFASYELKGAIHIQLADWADKIIVIPATADIMAKSAMGMADDIALATLLAFDGYKLYVPAMHTNMWNNPITRENYQKLKKLGIDFVDPIDGSLACGAKGVGHIADLKSILDKIKK